MVREMPLKIILIDRNVLDSDDFVFAVNFNDSVHEHKRIPMGQML